MVCGTPRILRRNQVQFTRKLAFGGLPLEKARVRIQQCESHTTFFHPPFYPQPGELSNRSGEENWKSKGRNCEGTGSVPASLHIFKPKGRPELGARDGKNMKLGVRLKFCFRPDDFLKI